MKSYLTILAIILMFLPNPVRSQDKFPLSFNFLTGINIYSCETPDKAYIRKYKLTTDNDVAASIRAYYNVKYFGPRMEVRILKNKLGIVSGFQFTRTTSTICKNSPLNLFSSRTFYVLYRQEGTTTEYMKVKEIKQVSHYFGLPVEFRVYPYRPKSFNVYYKIGVDFNLLIKSKTHVTFYDESFQYLEDEIAQIVEGAQSLYCSPYLGVGFRLGKDSTTGANIEICIPVFHSSFGNNPGLVSPKSGVGIQFNVRVPL